MKALIIEDERAAAQALRALVAEAAPDIDVVGALQSVEESVEWFSAHPAPDLVFMDIHLADGSSFAIFDRVRIACPVIFTTAYDQYALRAFDVNGVDYLLKPVDRARLERALGKVRAIRGPRQVAEENAQLVEKLLASMRRTGYKSALLIPVKDKLVPLPVKTIAYIYTADQMVRAVTFDGAETFIDQTLDELYAQLDPAQFYRANRQYIVARTAVKDLSLWFNGRYSVNLSVKTPERILVSRANAGDFKRWMTE